MPLVHNRYGKDAVRVMRVHRDGERHEVRELTVQAMVEGDFARAYTSADNSTCLSTDTIKNVVNVVARENLALDTELFCKAVADKLLSCYPQIESAFVSGHQTKWTRLAFDGVPHPHSFVLDANGKPFCEVRATPIGRVVRLGRGGLHLHEVDRSRAGPATCAIAYTTIAETDDRICATAMDARWEWSRSPADFTAANETILSTMIEVFATTYSSSVQDSLYRMGEAALGRRPGDLQGQPCLPEQALPAGQSGALQSRQRQPGVPADRRAARPDRMYRRPLTGRDLWERGERWRRTICLLSRRMVASSDPGMARRLLPCCVASKQTGWEERCSGSLGLSSLPRRCSRHRTLPAAAQSDLKFALDWKFEGPSAPYFVAIDKGYYKAEGLNVSIDSGPGSVAGIARVAAGTYPIGFFDINSLVRFRDQNPDKDVKAVHDGLRPAAVRDRQPCEVRASPSRRTSKARRSARRLPTGPSRSGRPS